MSTTCLYQTWDLQTARCEFPGHVLCGQFVLTFCPSARQARWRRNPGSIGPQGAFHVWLHLIFYCICIIFYFLIYFLFDISFTHSQIPPTFVSAKKQVPIACRRLVVCFLSFWTRDLVCVYTSWRVYPCLAACVFLTCNVCWMIFGDMLTLLVCYC